MIFTGSGTWDVKGKIGNLSRQAATAATGALAVNMSGAGKVTLFADNTTGGNDTWNILVNQGTLSFSALNNLGDGTGAIRLGQTNSSGVLEFTGSAGSGVSISRQVNIGNGANALDLGSSTITASGSTTADTLTFSNAAFNLPGNTPVANAGRSLTLRGANAGLNTISGVIADNTGLGGLVRVIKDDTGTWVLNGNTTFSNGVTITGGTLQAGHDSALGTGALNMNNATTARIRSTDGTARTFTNAVTISQTAIFGAAADALAQQHTCGGSSRQCAQPPGSAASHTGRVTESATLVAGKTCATHVPPPQILSGAASSVGKDTGRTERARSSLQAQWGAADRRVTLAAANLVAHQTKFRGISRELAQVEALQVVHQAKLSDAARELASTKAVVRAAEASLSATLRRSNAAVEPPEPSVAEVRPESKALFSAPAGKRNRRARLAANAASP